MKMFKSFKVVVMLIVCGAVSLVGFGCSYTSLNDSTGVGIPHEVEHIEFFNGGTCIGSYDNAHVEILIQTRDKLFKVSEGNAKTTFITYKVSVSGQASEFIVDSESLCIKYTVK